MKAIVTAALILISTISSWSQPDFKSKTSRIDSIMASHIIDNGKHPVHSFLLYARNEKTGFEFHEGVGTIGRNNHPVDAEYQYNIASITKTMVATIILQLEEEGKLSVNDKIDKYLGGIGFLNIDDINQFGHKSYGQEITIEMLLHHTSGIADIFTDAETRFNISVLLHKKRQFNTEKIMDRFYKYKLNRKAFYKP